MGPLCTRSGRPIRIGRVLGTGGEGTVYTVDGEEHLVAKLYHQPAGPEKGQKLVAMVAGCTDRLRKIAAWPTDTLHDRAATPARGFLMRRVSREKDIHLLFGPKTRLREYPEATYRFLVHVAANVARAFAVVHEHGHVVGDVNQGGIYVSPMGTVTLVDCDSFQIADAARLFACDVATPVYQPPECQSVRSFRGLAREPNHDCFGLAVLIFQTLFLARHPYAGTFAGDGEMPLERAIREFRFAYAHDATRRKMKQPPGSLGLGCVPVDLALMFERAFLEEGSKGKRPTALEWIAALDSFASALRECKRNAGHAYLENLVACPLCEIEGRAGVLLFLPPREPSGLSTPLKLDELWRELIAVQEEARVPTVNALRAAPKAASAPCQPEAFRRAADTHRSALGEIERRIADLEPEVDEYPVRSVRYKRLRAAKLAVAGAGILICLAVAVALSPLALGGMVMCLALAASGWQPHRKLDDLRDDLSAARERKRELRCDLEKAQNRAILADTTLATMAASRDRAAAILRELERYRISSDVAQVQQRLAEAQRRYHELQDFDQRRATRLRQFEMVRQQRQLARFLDQFEVCHCGLKGFGCGLVATLMSNGVETANDVSEQKLIGIHGFGPKRIGALVAWRRSIEAQFRFNSADPTDAQERATAERHLTAEYTRGIEDLRCLIGQAKASAKPIATRVQCMRAELTASCNAYDQAYAAALALGGTKA